MNPTDDANIEVIKRHLEKRKNLSRELLDFFERCDDLNPGLLLEQMEESDYSVADWGEALIVFDSWLEQQQQTARPFPTMVGYIHCCTLMNAPKVNLPSLKTSVFESLTEFGFDALSDPQI